MCLLPLSLAASVVLLHLLSAPDVRGPRLHFAEGALYLAAVQTAILLALMLAGGGAWGVTALYMVHDLGVRLGGAATSRATLLPAWLVGLLAALYLGAGGCLFGYMGDVAADVHLAALLLTDMAYAGLWLIARVVAP